MSEERGQYNVERKPGVIRPGCFRSYDDGWEQPTNQEVRNLLDALDIRAEEAASFSGVASGRSFRRYLQPPETKGARGIPYAQWRLLAERLARKRSGECETIKLRIRVQGNSNVAD